MARSHLGHLRALLLTLLMLFSTSMVPFGASIFHSDSSTLISEEGIMEGSGNQGIEVLIYGNSYTSGNNLANLVQDSLQNLDNSAVAQSLTSGGLKLSDHATRVQTAGHQWNTTLRNGNWNWVILQDQSQVPSFPTSNQYWQESKDGSIVLDQMISDNGAQTVFLMTWGRRDGDSQNQWRNPDFLTMQANLETGYMLYSENTSTPSRQSWIAPTGLAFKHIYNDVLASGATPEDSGNDFYNLFSSDGSHPSIYGSYLATCVIFSTITGVSSVGNSWPNSISSSKALYLQEVASSTVFNETQNLVYPWMSNNYQNFGNGQSSINLHPALNETTTIGYEDGTRITGVEFDFSGGPQQDWQNNTLNLSDSFFVNGSSQQTTVTGSGIGLSNSGNTSGAPWPNSGSLMVSGTLNTHGNHSYGTVHVSGLINSTGPLLKIMANTIIIEANASIRSNAIIWGGSGQGASGNLTNNGGYGANGGAHMGAGGVGGNNQNSTNMSYGNGTEAGSSGGNVTQTSSGTTTVHSAGGQGGGVIILIANNIYINGTISANGHDVHDGPPPPNGGTGISGAGGGSGGSVSIIANNVWWGQGGSVNARGGDGGDGSNGVRQMPIGLLMYDGGHGGGGGGGGSVNITTTTNGMHGNGRISVAGGTAGAGGLPYGSGRAGRGGTTGSTGVSQVSTSFVGWSGSSHASNGTFTSATHDVGGIVEGLIISVNSIIPTGTSVSGEFRTTLDNVTWSDWQQLSLTRQSTDRLRYFQTRFNLSTNLNFSTPIISGLSYSKWQWVALGSDYTPGIPLSFSITNNTPATNDWRAGDANGQDPMGNSVVLFHSTDFLISNGPTPQPGDVYTGAIEISVPLNATPQNGWIHLLSQGTGHQNTVTLSVGRAQLVSVDNHVDSYEIELPTQSLTAAWPTSGSTDLSGLEWGWLVLNWTSELPNPTFSHLSLPWNFTHRVGGGGEFVAGIEAMVLAECTDWYSVQGCRQDFPLMATGYSTVLDFSIILDNLIVSSIDDIPPRLNEVKMEVDGTETNVAQYGDMMTFLVTEQIGQSNLTILCQLVLAGASPNSGTQDQMQWDEQNQAYELQYDSTQFGSSASEIFVVFSCDMQDEVGNMANPAPLLQVSILPGPPVVSDFIMSSNSGPISGSVSTGTWRHDEPITMTVKEIINRSELNASVELSRRESSTVITVPLEWDNSTMSYTGIWEITRYNFGVWDLEVKLVDTIHSEMDEDGALITTDAIVTIVDRLAPILDAVSFDWSPTNPLAWRTTIEWTSEPNEIIDLWVAVTTDSGVAINYLQITTTSDKTGYADWDTTDIEPGRYYLEVFLEDSAGNSAADWLSGPDSVVVISPPRAITFDILEPVNGTEFVYGDTITYRFNISCNDGCEMSLEEEGITGLFNGTLEFNQTVADVGDITTFFTLSAGDLSITQMSYITVIAPPDPLFSLPSCVESESSDANMALAGHLEFICNVKNMGSIPSVVRFRVTDGHSQFDCTPTTSEAIPTSDMLEVFCHTQGEVEEATGISTNAVFEWQDYLGNWNRIGSEQAFSISLIPYDDGTQDSADSTQTGKGVSTMVLAGGAIGIVSILGVLLAFFIQSRGRRRDEESHELNPSLHSAVSSHGSDAPVIWQEDGSGMLVNDGTIKSEPVPIEQGLDWVPSYEGLPPGGRYEEVPEGLWYVDAEENWWWSEQGGSWRKT